MPDCEDDNPNGLCPIDDTVAAPPPDYDLLDAPVPEAYRRYFPDLRLPKELRHPELAPLADRLVQFLSRPALSHKDALEANQAGCPADIIDQLTNPALLSDHQAYWIQIDANEIIERRAELVQYLAKQVEAGHKVLGTMLKGPDKRGIVLTGGNGDTVLRIEMLLRHLRKIGSKLPVEVVHFSDELNDKKYRKRLEKLGAKLVAVQGVEKTPGAWKNYQIKAMAMIQSSFTELIYLDSDNVPLRTLDHLFSAPLYEENGRAAFWPDISKDHADNAIWRIVGDTCHLREWTFESGQIVLDKRGNSGNNLAALWLAAGMLEQQDFYFTMCGGDKDTFRWAFRMLDLAYAPAPRWLSALGILNEFDDNRFCGHTMLQYDLVAQGAAPPPLFVHSNLLKYLEGGLEQGRVFTHIKHLPLDLYDEASLNSIFFFVYHGNGRGMCTDMLVHGNAEEKMGDALYAMQQPLVVGTHDFPELEGFEDAWWKAGGRVGGW
ncbi:hypothetical protein CC85DRAFT_247698 [Cutaneotrichosporon oleaginosum]|uniref:Mannosyltransferase putative-domain-containing protein n=1 Tax=Cutaneotrichosporon oleaginosum TaxID=879819 RepID=A0A0J0XK26_9TREE|nr:uncharacterized protein CC85DRAFT_247698 [Cutaneotrichosporon oleaginosum]KLT41430.1 hypothetical protein CC85DRAFT_247698 [Cutaneotrichosporon oleaginosum]TXT12192.1 hypothetical protein COLE_02602 [Cutaneotrichosporon oleaginosum]